MDIQARHSFKHLFAALWLIFKPCSQPCGRGRNKISCARVAIAGSALQYLLMARAALVHAKLLSLNGYGPEEITPSRPVCCDESYSLFDVPGATPGLLCRKLVPVCRTYAPTHLGAVQRKRLQDLTPV